MAPRTIQEDWGRGEIRGEVQGWGKFTFGVCAGISRRGEITREEILVKGKLWREEHHEEISGEGQAVAYGKAVDSVQPCQHSGRTLKLGLTSSECCA